MPKETIADRYHENFFKDEGVHNKSVGHIQGYMQAEADLHDPDELDESFFAYALEKVVRTWSRKISNAISVLHNKEYKNFNSTLKDYSSLSISIRPDIQVKNVNGDLLAVYELKSYFGNGTKKKDLMRDIARLAIFKKLFPDINCLFIFPGKRKDLQSFFEKSHFKFENNITRKIKPPYKWVDIHISELKLNVDTSYQRVLDELEVEYVKIRLSRTEKGGTYCTLSWVIDLQPQGYRPFEDYKQCSWDEIIEEDFIYTGPTPPDQLQKCDKVESIDYKNSKVLFTGNGPEESEWVEFSKYDIVWKCLHL